MKRATKILPVLFIILLTGSVLIQTPLAKADFTLELDASYDGSILSLDYTIGTPEPATWANYLILIEPTVQVIPLWTVSLPVIDPPISFPISFSLPSMGLIGIWTGLFTAEGAQVVDIAWVDTAGDMVDIPAGEFVMGSDPSDPPSTGDEYPEHVVWLSPYEIDLYEVTNSEFADFLNAYGLNISPEGYEMLDADDDDRHIYWEDISSSWYAEGRYGDHPVIEVTWYGANTYCDYNGKRLPTEAEWEKAARGGCEVGGSPGTCEDPADERTYPWGEGIDCGHANYYGCVGDTTPVGSYPLGVSPYGPYDMAGNVWEWVKDWFGYDYYDSTPYMDPQGPVSGTSRGLRGGSWNLSTNSLRVANRNYSNPGSSGNNGGFRCAR